MFNNYTTNQNIKINSISGTLVKNYIDSFFVYHEHGSNYSRMLFNNNPIFYCKNSDVRTEPVVVLQTMIISEKGYLSEIIYKEDFDKLFE